MQITAIYSKYHILPNLQLHMRRVAAVGVTIAQHAFATTQHVSAATQPSTPFFTPAELDDITAACLLHDMGNIVKFDLTVFPEFLEPEGAEFWQHIQKQVIERYGTDVHVVTKKIVEEIGVSERVQKLVAAVGFDEAAENLASDDVAKKICDYADTRVTPSGVTSLEERIADLNHRYVLKYPGKMQQQRRDTFAEVARALEKQIFRSCDIKPEDITEETTATLRDQLQTFDVRAD